MGIDENKRIIEAFYEANNRGDMDAFLAILGEDLARRASNSLPSGLRRDPIRRYDGVTWRRLSRSIGSCSTLAS